MKHRPTIIDVAKYAGVSKSTVSLVLQESPLVKKDTQQAVRKAMADLGYVYNRAAANLRRSNVGLIGLVINNLRNPFFTEFATSVQMALSKNGYATVIANTDENSVLQAQVIASMIEHGVSAIIISPTYGDEAKSFEPLRRAKIPVLQVLRMADKRSTIFPFSSFDYAAGSALATENFIKRGAKRIAFVGGLKEHAITQERLSGYLQVMKKHRLTPMVFAGRATRVFGQETAKAIAAVQEKIEAVLSFNDLVALGLLSGFAKHGIDVGKEILLTGFDDIEECAAAFTQLSSVRCDINQFGQQTAATLLRWLEDGIKPPKEMRMPVELMLRAS